MTRRRLRAAGALVILWAAPWAVLGAILGARFVLIGTGGVELIPLLAALCALYGSVIGLAFCLLIAALAHWSRGLHQLSITWVALAVGAVAWVLGARAEPGYAAASLFAVVGAACAATSLAIARRGADNLANNAAVGRFQAPR
jgi:hypothetical protein